MTLTVHTTSNGIAFLVPPDQAHGPTGLWKGRPLSLTQGVIAERVSELQDDIATGRAYPTRYILRTGYGTPDCRVRRGWIWAVPLRRGEQWVEWLGGSMTWEEHCKAPWPKRPAPTTAADRQVAA